MGKSRILASSAIMFHMQNNEACSCLASHADKLARGKIQFPK